MRNPASLYREGNSFGAGVRAAVLVVVLGIFAAAVDLVTVRPLNPSLHAAITPPPVTAPMTAEPIKFPPELRSHEGDVTPPVATF